jgi:hypothetical protein
MLTGIQFFYLLLIIHRNFCYIFISY